MIVVCHLLHRSDHHIALFWSPQRRFAHQFPYRYGVIFASPELALPGVTFTIAAFSELVRFSALLAVKNTKASFPWLLLRSFKFQNVHSCKNPMELPFLHVAPLIQNLHRRLLQLREATATATATEGGEATKSSIEN